MLPSGLRLNTLDIDDDLAAAHRDAGASDVAARVLSARRVTPEHVRPSLAQLDDPSALPDIDKAADRIANAIINGEYIAIETDYDVDGTTAHAIIRGSLIKYLGADPDRVISFIGHRLKEGYGLSDPLANRIMADGRVNLVITADNGTSDEPRIRKLRDAGIETIVTDHHGIPDSGLPQSAFAVVSPARSDSKYPDPTIAGCMTAFLLMTRVRRRLMAVRGGSLPPLGIYVDYAACGTVADCVSLASVNNRAIVRSGLKMITAGRRPCWQSAMEQLSKPGEPVGSDVIGYQIGPRINARTRLDDPMAALGWLMAEDEFGAVSGFDLLTQENDRRKDIEAEMRVKAIEIAKGQLAAGLRVACVFLEDGHKGVNGIVASRVRDALGCMSLVLSPDSKNRDMATGSLRTGTKGPHVLNAMKLASRANPELLPHFGGHAGAGGLSTPINRIDALGRALHEALLVMEAEAGMDSSLSIAPELDVDGELDPRLISLDLVDEFRSMEPFGQRFEYPSFRGLAEVASVRTIGKDGNHRKLRLRFGDVIHDAVLFGVDRMPGARLVDQASTLDLAYTVRDNFYRGRRTLQLQVLGIAAAG